jgi:N utilization substance protein A
LTAPKIKLTNEEMRYIALFESITGATIKDCLIDQKEKRIIFIAKEGDMGLAIGKGGKNINLFKKMTNHSVEMVEYANTPEQLIRNALAPARIKNIRFSEKSGKKIAIVEVDPKDKAIAIGKNGRTIEKTRMLVRRYFQIDHIVIV